MITFDLSKFEALKGRTITVKNGRYYYFSSRAGRTLPVKKTIAMVLIAENFCELLEA